MLHRLRIVYYRHLSTMSVDARIVSPVLAVGPGRVEASGATFGYVPSPGMAHGCIHLDTRHRDATIRVGTGTTVNNGGVLIAEGPGITIGARCLIGPEVHIYDSDFHGLDFHDGKRTPPAQAAVTIGDDVFIGSRATICKGVTIGDRATIGAGAVVVSDVPADAVAAGNPAKILRY